MGDSRCAAHTRFKPTEYSDNHTVRCQLDADHEGAHTWRRDAREVSWYGPATGVEDTTRLRFGRWLEN